MLPAPEAAEPRSRLAWGLAIGAVVALVVATISAALVPVPYYSVRPGSVRPVGELVHVAGAAEHPPESPVAFTTVNIREVSLLEAAASWFDPDVDLVPEEQIRGGRTADENRQMNVVLMDTSKQVAITVALRHLGYDVAIRTSGTVVLDVQGGLPADGKLEPGDVIVAVDGTAVDEPGILGELLQAREVGATYSLTVERVEDGSTETVEVATVGNPDDPTRGLIGITTSERIADFEYPFDVDIESGTVGGPSAGLAFTLAVLDHLTPGELTGGRRVAATGTMALDGTVGNIGGAPQKAVAVRRLGYEVFLVPADLVDEVEDKAGDDLQVIGVATLDDALEALASLGGNAHALGRPGEERPAA